MKEPRPTRAIHEEFYRALEDKFRGPRETITSRLRIYLPFLEPLKSFYANPAVVDLGCGRGEWLELLRNNGFEAQGVDLDEGMLASCYEQGLRATNEDAIEFLKKLPSESQSIVSGFHIAEHLPFSELQALVQESLRVLKPAGFLILETPNPENFKVSCLTFYNDPTHRHQIPPDLLSFLPEYYGFERIKVIRLQESSDLLNSATATLDQVLGGASPDYAVIAQKATDGALARLFDSVFDKEFGLSANLLIRRFDQQLMSQNERAAALETRSLEESKARAALETRLAEEGRARAALEARLAAIYASTSWRITAPLRSSRWFVEGAWAWLTLKPGSRPRRIARRTVVVAAQACRASPLFAPLARKLLHWIPAIEARLKGIIISEWVDSVLDFEPFDVRLAYQRLRAAKETPKDTLRSARLSGARPRLAYVCPLPPARSGVAHYSAELLTALSAHYDIDAIVIQELASVSPVEGCRAIYDIHWFERHAHDFDRIIYHLGNSTFHHHMFALLEKFPGVVVLHDFYFGHLLGFLEEAGGRRGYWTRALYHAHGYEAVRRRFKAGEYASLVWDYPANLFILQQAQGIVVHNEFSRALARRFYGERFSDKQVIIPLLRKLPGNADREAARASLGIAPNEFLVCSFGFLGESKLNDRLLDAWLASRLREKQNCHLVFVGEAPKIDYCERLRASIKKSSRNANIRITGYAAPQLYQQYLAAADLSVQLRCRSRGETSGAVLDCMAYGLPVVINAHDSMAEIPDDCVIKLSDTFTQAALIAALERCEADPLLRRTLGGRARNRIARKHAPATVADRYREAIDNFAKFAPPLFDVNALSLMAADLPALGEDNTVWLEKARGLASDTPLKQPARQLLVDISALMRDDLRTGIQRVIIAQLSALLNNPPNGFRIEPVWLCESKESCQLRYARRFTTSRLLGINCEELADDPVTIAKNDVYYMPDYFPHGVVQAEKAGVYAKLRDSGVRLNFMVYDILPILEPQFFPKGHDKLHEAWLRTISANADQLVCISRVVADETKQWLEENARTLRVHPRFAVLHLGAEIDFSQTSNGFPEDAPMIFSALASRPTFLMVGTIEPRKGYSQTLGAFDQLWAFGVNANLVMVGAEGWASVPESERRNIPEIVARLRGHPERGHRLFWLNSASDEYLNKLYSTSTCLIAASEAEGFGLPLIEAAKQKLPIIARDIPVFREVAGEHATYFSGLEARDLSKAIRRWLSLQAEGRHTRSDAMPWITWAENAGRLKVLIVEA